MSMSADTANRLAYALVSESARDDLVADIETPAAAVAAPVLTTPSANETALETAINDLIASLVARGLLAAS